MMSSQERFTQICTFLDQQDWKYGSDPEQQVLGLRVEDMMLMIAVSEDGQLIAFILGQLLTLNSSEPNYEAALQVLGRLDGENKLIQWQRNPDDGEVLLLVALPIEDSELTAQQFWWTLQESVQIAKLGLERLQEVLATGQDTGNSSSGELNQNTLAFFRVLLEAEYEGGEAAVYRELDKRGGQLDPQLPQAAKTFLEQFSTSDAETRDAIVVLIENLANSLQKYPSGRWQINLAVAIGLYQLVLEARPRETVPHKYAQTLTNLGVAYLTQAEFGENPSTNLQKAIAVYNEAANILRKLGLESDLCTTLTNLGSAYLTQAQLGENPSANLKSAIAVYDEAAKIRRKLGLDKDLSATLNNLGIAYQTQAQLGENPSANLMGAVAVYNEAAKIRRKLGLDKDLSATLNNLGSAYGTQAQLGENPSANLMGAIAVYNEAANIRRKLGLDKDLSTTLNNLGYAYLTQAEFGENPSTNLMGAIVVYDEAAKIRRKLGLESDLSSTLTCLGIAYQTQAELVDNPSANLKSAIAVYDEAAKIRRKLGLDKDLSSTLNNLGIAYQTQAELGENPSANLKDAIAVYNEAANNCRKLGLEKDLSGTLTNLGSAYRTQAELGENPSANLQKAANCYREALKFFRPQLLPVECLTAARTLGNLGFQQGDWQMALEGYQTAMAAIDYSRTQRVSNKERLEVVAKSIYIYENAIQAAINLKDIPTALEIVERVRAKRLVDLLATADLYQNGDIPDEVRQFLEKLNDLDNEIAQKRGELGDESRQTQPDGMKTRQPRAATEVAAEIAQREEQKQDILDELSNLDEVVAKLRQVKPPKLEDFIPLLQDSPGSAILSFYTTRDDTHIFILRHGETVPTCFTCRGQGMKTLQLWLRKMWVSPYAGFGITEEDKRKRDEKRKQRKQQWERRMPKLLAALSRRLEIDRLIEEKLQGLDELILIPHLFLHQIPFAALPVSGEIPPSSHTPHRWRPHTPHPTYLGDKFILRYAPSVQVLGFCHNRHPVNTQKYGIAENATNDLPCSGFEGAKVAEMFGVKPEQRLIGAEATRQKYRQLLEIITHLVSTHHAQSRYDNSLESGLRLSDGNITVSQLLSPGWRFKELDEVFLSCCETGLFLPNSLIDEPVAVSTGFLCAGARGVIASQWAIDDLSAALLSILYHEQRKHGKDRPVALQAAQQKMRQMTGADFQKNYQKPLQKHLKAEKARILAIPDHDPDLLTSVADSEKSIKRYAADKGCPFQQPVHWASLGCYGLR